MDSLTQLALGAAVGEAVLGHKVGHRALVWGALCGTLPDLDVLIPLGDAVSNFTYHRSASHSLFVLAILTPIIALLIAKIHPDAGGQRRDWNVLVYLVFVTHVLLDCFTVYGTQIFWPISTWPVSWSSIFIIDPLYTLPVLAGVISALILRRRTSIGYWLNIVGLCLSSAYLIWSLSAQHYVHQLAQKQLSRENLGSAQMIVLPTPLNTVLWRILVVQDETYYEGFYSLLDDPSAPIRLARYTNQPELLNGIEDYWPVMRLQWFSKGFYSVWQQGQSIIITDLRMGMEPNYVFNFKVAENHNLHTTATPVKRLPMRWSWEQIEWVWKRL